MPDSTGQMTEFRSEDTGDLLFLAKMFSVPLVDQEVKHNDDMYKVERVRWVLTEDHRIQYCHVQPQVFLSAV